jgi:hypothetical protein
MKIDEIALAGKRKRPARMRPKRMVQKEFFDPINEAKEGKNTHLEHLEDEIINKGHNGINQVVTTLQGLSDMLAGHADHKYKVSTKWDGAPAIICGIDPTDRKFFVGTKSVFAKEPKLVKSKKDVTTYYGDKPELAQKMLTALTYLSRLGINTVLQGDMLFSGPNDLKEATIDGEAYLTFRPNTITYAVPAGSELAAKIRSSKMGIVFHTEYVGGPTLAEMTAEFGYDAGPLTHSTQVWVNDALVKDFSGSATMTAGETKAVNTAIANVQQSANSIKAETFAWIDHDLGGVEFKTDLKAHINSMIKTAGAFESDPAKFAESYVNRYRTKMLQAIDMLKTEKGKAGKQATMEKDLEFLNKHINELKAFYNLYMRAMTAKLFLVKKLAEVKSLNSFLETGPGEYKVTPEEGKVIIDHMGNAVKLVDRLEFSKANFTMPKNWGTNGPATA